MTRLIASLVLRNEAGRYLRSVLEWHRQYFDDFFVYDDQSADATAEICREFTEHVHVRPDDTPSFLQHEGKFRERAWAVMIDAMGLRDNDWVFSLDADEYLVNTCRADLESLISEADRLTVNSVDIPIPEIWDRSTSKLMKRIDGWWNTMSLPRLCRIQRSNIEFRKKPMGCGSTPLYSYKLPVKDVNDLALLHFGYSLPEERRARYDRYMGLPDHGHNNKHIKSIIANPHLEPWEGEIPVFSYG